MSKFLWVVRFYRWCEFAKPFGATLCVEVEIVTPEAIAVVDVLISSFPPPLAGPTDVVFLTGLLLSLIDTGILWVARRASPGPYWLWWAVLDSRAVSKSSQGKHFRTRLSFPGQTNKKRLT